MRIVQTICDLCGQEVHIARIPEAAVLNPDQLELPITYQDHAGAERQVCVSVSWAPRAAYPGGALPDKVRMDYHPDCLARLMYDSVVDWAKLTGQHLSTNPDPKAHFPAVSNVIDGSGTDSNPS